jgi:hypothetical protein
MPVSQWLGDLIKTVTREETIDFTVTDPLTVGGSMLKMEPLTPSETYISIKVRSLRLPFTRKGFTKIHGVVHSFANLPGAGSEAVEFVSATTPSALSGLDPKNISNVIVIDKQVVGPTPWHGGNLRLQIGLFSVIEQELAGAFLSTMTALSEKVGVTFVASARPFLDVISMGVSALTRQVGSVKLEIGMDKSFTPPVPGTYALIAAPVGDLSAAKFDVDPNDGKLKVDGKHYEKQPYLVFTIEAVSRQERWGEIAELRNAYIAIRDSVKGNDQSKAREAMISFRLLTLTSSDLVEPDALRLIDAVNQRLALAFGSPMVSGMPRSDTMPEFENLAPFD